MAFRYLQSFISFFAGDSYAGIVQHWGVDGDASHSKFDLAKDLANGIITPSDPGFGFPLLLPCLSEDTYISAIRTREIMTSGAPSFVQAFPIDSHVGSYSGDAGASQDAGTIIALTGGDAGLTGRFNLPGVSIEALVSGRFDVDYKSATSDLIVGLLAGVAGALNTYQPFVKHGVSPAFALITNAYLSPTAGTQRRRLRPY